MSKKEILIWKWFTVLFLHLNQIFVSHKLPFLILTLLPREENLIKSWLRLYMNVLNWKPHTHVVSQNYPPNYLEQPKNQPNHLLAFLTQSLTHGILWPKIWKQRQTFIVMLLQFLMRNLSNPWRSSLIVNIKHANH